MGRFTQFIQLRVNIDGPHGYALCGADGWILIDPPPHITPELLMGQGIGTIAGICLTHTQADSADGCVHFPDARIHVPAGDEYLCQGPESYAALIQPWPPPWDWDSRGNYQGHLAGAANERPLSIPVRLDTSLIAGTTVAGLEVLFTPGHGKHAVTLIAQLADGRRVGFCGDLVHTGGTLWNWYDCDWDYGPQTGQRTLLDSARRLRERQLDVLYPTHGPAIERPAEDLSCLIERLAAVLDQPAETLDASNLLVETVASPAPGFRQLLPGLHQYVAEPGNCAVLVSRDGYALLIDDGLCHWVPLPERLEYHRRVMADLKKALDIRRIEWVIPTHYHGDHIENIPDLCRQEGARVLSLDLLVEVLEHPERYNLVCLLPWYGTQDKHVVVHERVASGKRWRWREYELEIFHLAGQTHYHSGIAAIIAGKRVVFAGDAVGSIDVRSEAVLTYNDNEPLQRGWVYALDRLIEREPELLVGGHTFALRAPLPWLKMKRKHWSNQIERYRRLSARSDLRLFFDPFVNNERKGT